MHPDNPIQKQFAALRVNCAMVAKGKYVCTAASGPAGIGKTHIVQNELKQRKVWFRRLTGSSSIAGIVSVAYEMRKGGLILLDDCDGVIIGSGMTGANVMKALLDPGEHSRLITVQTKEALTGKALYPAEFETKVNFIWLTNADLSPSGIMKLPAKSRPHIEALLSRGLSPLTITTDPKWILDYILDLIDNHRLLEKISQPLKQSQARDLRAWFVQHAERLPQLSVRLLVDRCAPMVREHPDDWRTWLNHVILEEPERAIGLLPAQHLSAPAPTPQLALVNKLQ